MLLVIVTVIARSAVPAEPWPTNGWWASAWMPPGRRISARWAAGRTLLWCRRCQPG